MCARIRVIGDVVGVDGPRVARLKGRVAEIVVAAVLARGNYVRVGWVSNAMKQKARNACGKKENLQFDRYHVRLERKVDVHVDLWEIEDAWTELKRSAKDSPPDLVRLKRAVAGCRRFLDGSYFDAELARPLDDLRISVDAEDSEYSGRDDGHFSRAREAHALEQLERLKFAAGVAHALNLNETKYHFYYELRARELRARERPAADMLGPGVKVAFDKNLAILSEERHQALRAAAEGERLKAAHTPERIEPRYRAPGERLLGRDEDLAHLTDQLDLGLHGKAGAVVVLHGPDGIGKGAVADALARERVKAGWSVVRRLRVADGGELSKELPQLARDLGWTSPTPGADEQQRAADWLRAELPALTPWLLVIEEVLGPDTLKPLLLCPAGGAILVVSKNPNWAGCRYTHVTEIEAHSPAAAQKLFAWWANVPVSPAVERLCEKVENRVGWIQPLARMVRDGKNTVEELLDKEVGHERIAALLDGFETSPGVRGLLDVVAVIDHEEIPLALLVGVAAELAGMGLVRPVIAELESVGLVTRSDRWAERFSVRALEHSVMAERLGPTRRAGAVLSATEALLRAMPEWPLDAKAGARGAALVRHADVLAHRAQRWSHELPPETRIRVATLLGRVADYRRWSSDWEEAERDLRLAVSFGDDDLDPVGRARRELALGNLLRKRGKLAPHADEPGAEELIERAVSEIKTHGDELEVARALTVQARLHRVRGELDDALKLLEEAVPVLERERGSSMRVTDRELADAYGWLAGTCRRLGRRKDAARWIERALERCAINVSEVRAGRYDLVSPTRQALKHLRTLGTIERGWGRVLTSLAMQRFVLNSRIDALGKDHHLVAVSHVEVARDELTVGRLEVAAEHALEADRISVERCGKNYPHRGTAQVLLAIVDRDRGDYRSARSRLLTASEIFKVRESNDRLKVVDHLDFAVDVGDCALMLAVETARECLSHDEAAEPASARAIAQAAIDKVKERRRLRVRVLGQKHPHVATCDSADGEIERLLWKASLQGKDRAARAGDHATAAAWNVQADKAVERAREGHQNALEKRERTLEQSDPNIGWTLEHLGDIAAELGDTDAARDAWRRCAEIRRESLGADSPLTRRVAERLSSSTA